MSKRRLLPRLLRGALVLCAVAFAALTAAAIHRLWPKTIDIHVPGPNLTWRVDERGRMSVAVPGAPLIGILGGYRDELYAYLMYDFVRSRPALAGHEALLVSQEDGARKYVLQITCPNDLLECIQKLYQLRAQGLADSPSWFFTLPETLARNHEKTRIFVQAYAGPVTNRFQDLSPEQRVRYLRRFIRFKSATDPRVLSSDGASPEPLTEQQAFELAGDVIAVADFYELPLEYFLGIGAMENNYMNVKGDLEHTVWKRRAQPGDVIVRRGRRAVLVRNPSVGVWQITRETLRYAHALYLKDQRDYSRLPDRLRPPAEIDLDNVDAPVLTTYAGLLLRHLLDYFHGDVGKAVGAYNGGAGKPNPIYEAGVTRVAEYARQILDRAAFVNDAAVASVQQ